MLSFGIGALIQSKRTYFPSKLRHMLMDLSEKAVNQGKEGLMYVEHVLIENESSPSVISALPA